MDDWDEEAQPCASNLIPGFRAIGNDLTNNMDQQPSQNHGKTQAPDSTNFTSKFERFLKLEDYSTDVKDLNYGFDDWDESKPVTAKNSTFSQRDNFSRNKPQNSDTWDESTEYQSNTAYSQSKPYSGYGSGENNTGENSRYPPRGSGYGQRGRGFGGRGRGSYNPQDTGQEGRRSYNNFGDNPSRGDSTRGSYSGGRSYRPSESTTDFANDGEDRGRETSNRPPVYFREGLSDDVKDVFSNHISEGVDFSKYKSVKVQVSGGDEKQDFISQFSPIAEISDTIYSNIQKCGYTEPTPIQKFTIPIILKGEHDIMGCAQTGSGKTAAFLIPIFGLLLAEGVSFDERSIAAPYLLVISPTRELCSQIWLEMRKFCYSTKIRAGVAYGGVSRNFLMRYLGQGCDALSATPGRLLELVQNNIISLQKVKYLVIDEADRMLNLNFFGDIRKIIYNYGMPPQDTRRCYMFSATFPVPVQKIASEILAPNYYFLTVGVVGSAADSISQKLISIPPHEKRNKLLEILAQNHDAKVLVFASTKKGVDFLTTFLCQKDMPATSIHGDRYQEQREEALKSFTKGETSILVATSVAARGLDIPGVNIVVNYDLPSEIDEYVHRIGRTGRLGNLGVAISFFTEGRDDAMAPHLVRILKDAKQEVPAFLENFDHLGDSNVKFASTRDDRDVSRRYFDSAVTGAKSGEGTVPPALIENEEEAWD